MRKLYASLAASALALGLSACGSDGGGSGGGDAGTVGVAMPTKSSERWIADGNNIKSQLEEAGYEVDLQYAEDDIPTQVSQVENMVTKEVDVLVIAAVDGTALGEVLDQAEELEIPVIAYDRLIRESEAVDYYTTFDNFKVGVLQAESLVEGLEAKGKPPYNVELFAGSPDDNNAHFFFDGAMSVLQPMIDSGDIKVVSGQQEFDQVAILRWDPATAQKRMEDILTSTYTGSEQVEGVLSPYDGLSLGIIAALQANGYSGADLPVVTGQDAEVASVKSILADEQYSTIYKDTRELAKVTVDMIKAVEAGEDPEVNDTETYDNGVKVVPSYLLDPVKVTKDEVQSVLVDSGYYEASEIE
nr:multiple monosaccharide ABC transporter substrate-binding protein [uncultured Friedmanniella sp.]